MTNCHIVLAAQRRGGSGTNYISWLVFLGPGPITIGAIPTAGKALIIDKLVWADYAYSMLPLLK